MAEAYLNGKAGKWRTVGGRKIFIAEGQSLEDAMRASGKFDGVYKKSDNIDKKIAELKKKRDSQEFNNAIARDAQKEIEKLEKQKVELEKNNSNDNSKKDVPTKYLERGEMMDVIDKWSDKGFNEEGAYGNDGYGKGVLHERFASGQLEGFGGEADDFVIKDLDMGSVDQRKALNALNEELAKKGYEAKYLNDPDQTVHQDIEIKKIKVDSGNKNTTKTADLDKLKSKYQKLDAEYKKYADLAHNAEYGTADYEKYSAKRSEAYKKMETAKVEMLTEFNKTIPYNEMFEAGKKISGAKHAEFGEPELVNRNGNLYTKYSSNDIRQDAGIFGPVLRGARLENFNSSLYIDDKGELTYWGSMDIRYQHNGGGTNGMQVMQYRYNSKTGWDITDSAGYKYKNGKKITTISALTDYYMEYYGYSKENARAMAKASLEDVTRRETMIDY